MAFDWKRFNFFSRLDARARVLVLFGSVIGFIFLIYLLVRIFFGSGATTGASTVANIPQGTTSVPGSVTTAEYSRSLQQARNSRAQEAAQTGGTAVPTLINPGQMQGNSCIICSDESTTVNTALDDWVRQGKISPDVANSLEQLAANNVPVDQYAAELDRLVKAGKLTPEQARELLDRYKKQHANALAQQSAKAMDALIKSGELPTQVANSLLALQRSGVGAADYAGELDRLVNNGQIASPTASRLLAQFTQQCQTEAIKQNNNFIDQAARRGEITQQIGTELTRLSNNNVSVTDYSRALNNFVNDGRITPAAATKLVSSFNQFKSACGGAHLINQLIEQAEAAAYKELADLLAANKITKEVASQLATLIKNNVSLADFQNAVNALVQQGKLTADIAKLKIADYQRVKGLRDQAARLAELQKNNASPQAYADELKRAVQAGIITPEEAARLLREYQAATTRAPANLTTTGGGPASQAANALASSLQGTAVQPIEASAAQFAAAQTQASAESAQDRQARLQAMMTAMSNQATQLIAAWQPPVMQGRTGSFDATGGKTTTTATNGANGGTTTTTTTTSTTAPAPALIKAGTVLFAVLDTAINSDYPDTPVMATIVNGPFQGAKLLGRIMTTKGVTGQMDRVALTFSTMNMDEWPASKSINAFAIDPDTARTVMASSVDYHYLQRFGAMFATSFLQGYATAIMTSGSTQTTGIFGTSSVHPELSPSSKLMVGLGQVGQTLGQATANYINRPPTVRVDSGVGLGILFMNDTTT